MKESKLQEMTWVKVAEAKSFPEEGGACVKVEDDQIAVFNFSSKREWFACQNLCPHKQQMILSRGMLGDRKGEPKVACPFHKKQFSLETGQCLDDESCDHIITYAVKEEEGFVYIGK